MSPPRNTLSAPSRSTAKSARSTAAPASPPNFSPRSTISPTPTTPTRSRLSSPPTSSNSSRQPPSPTSAGTKVAVGLGKIRKVAAQDGSEPSLSHDGKKLLYTRPDNKTGPDRTIVLYDTTTGRSQDLVHGGVREAFWSPDDARVAYLNFQDQKWQLYIFSAAAPQQGTAVFTGSLTSLHGWVDAHTLLASDMQNAYWITDDGRTTQTIPLKEIYGDEFDITGSDTFRVNPINPDLLLVAAPYVKAPAGARPIRWASPPPSSSMK